MSFNRGISTLALVAAGAFVTPTSAQTTTTTPPQPGNCPGVVVYETGPNGQLVPIIRPGNCTPPLPTPSPTPTPPATVQVPITVAPVVSPTIGVNPHISVTGAPSTSSAGVHTGNIGSTSGVHTGNIGSSSSVTLAPGSVAPTAAVNLAPGAIAPAATSTSGVTLAPGSVAPTATAGVTLAPGSVAPSATVERGAVANENNYSSSTVYRAAASTAMSSAGGTQGHGCFRGKGAVSLGVQAVGGGASVTFGGGTEYELVDIEVVDEKGVPLKDADGKIVTRRGNICAQDQVTLATIYNGTNGTPAQRAMAATTAAAASPAANQGLNRVMANRDLVSLFGGTAPANEPAGEVRARGGVVPPTTTAATPSTVNNYIMVDATGRVVQADIKCGDKEKITFNARDNKWQCVPN
jgi:hypothetical protein